MAPGQAGQDVTHGGGFCPPVPFTGPKVKRRWVPQFRRSSSDGLGQVVDGWVAIRRVPVVHSYEPIDERPRRTSGKRAGQHRAVVLWIDQRVFV